MPYSNTSSHQSRKALPGIGGLIKFTKKWGPHGPVPGYSFFFKLKCTKLPPAQYHFNKLINQNLGVSNINFAKMSLKPEDRERSTVVHGSAERNTVPCTPKKLFLVPRGQDAAS